MQFFSRAFLSFFTLILTIAQCNHKRCTDMTMLSYRFRSVGDYIDSIQFFINLMYKALHVIMYSHLNF